MDHNNLINLVVYYAGLARDQQVTYREFYRNPQAPALRHEFLFFIKPEITSEVELDKLKDILELMTERIDAFGFIVADARILSATYLRQFNLMAKHYGVINLLSTHALENMSPRAVEQFIRIYGEKPAKNLVLGGHEFLRRYQQYDPEKLNQKWSSSRIEKLAGGTYCAEVEEGGRRIWLVNGFHPMQLNHFTATGRSIVSFTLRGNLSWQAARNQFIGKTDPSEAVSGSLRNMLHMRGKELGVKQVSSGRNGFHLSAGPVEGLAELVRYNSNYLEGQTRDVQEFTFGRMLSASFSKEEVKAFTGNCKVRRGEEIISVFDLTEEKDNEEALYLLKQSTILKNS